MQEIRSKAHLLAFPATLRLEAFAGTRRGRFACYFASLLIGICIFAPPLKDLMAMSLSSELYDYIPLMFPLTGYLLVRERKEIFNSPAYSFAYGVPVLILSLAAGASGLWYMGVLSPEDHLCVMSFSFWLFLMGTFILFFGARAFVKAIFPMCMLLFTVPLPAWLLDHLVELLRQGSYLSTSWIFHALGFVPLEVGFSFTLPQISITVAKNCSGIHFCTALVINALLGSRYYLRSWVNRLLLPICAVLIAMFKNGVRIAALTLAAIYVNPDILSTVWHRDLGIIIFGLGFALLTLVLLVMRKLEKRKPNEPAVAA
jgi:exosortase